jgi:hypothetical protein
MNMARVALLNIVPLAEINTVLRVTLLLRKNSGLFIKILV